MPEPDQMMYGQYQGVHQFQKTHNGMLSGRDCSKMTTAESLDNIEEENNVSSASR